MKITRGKFFVMDCQEIEIEKKTEIDKHNKYTTSLFILSLGQFQDINLMRRNIIT